MKGLLALSTSVKITIVDQISGSNQAEPFSEGHSVSLLPNQLLYVAISVRVNRWQKKSMSSFCSLMVCVCVCVRVRACACVLACVRARVRARVCFPAFPTIHCLFFPFYSALSTIMNLIRCASWWSTDGLVLMSQTHWLTDRSISLTVRNLPLLCENICLFSCQGPDIGTSSCFCSSCFLEPTSCFCLSSQL